MNNCLEDGKKRVENMVYFHSGLSSVEFQKVCAKTLDQNIYVGSGKELNSQITSGMLLDYS